MSDVNKSLRVLLVEDSENDALLVVRALREGAYDVRWERVETAEAMRAVLMRQTWDLVITDYQMPRFSGPAALELLRASGVDIPLIIISGTIGEDVAVAMMKAGAHDYLMKGKLARLVPSVERELREAAVRQEHRRAEAARRDAETRYRLLFEQSPDGIVTIDPDTTQMLEFNETAHRQLGYSREEFSRLRINDYESIETLGMVRARIAKLAAGGRDDFETRHRTRQGDLRDIQVTAQLIEILGRTVCHCVLRDITARKIVERQLHEQNEILSNSHEGVMIVSLENRVRLWNRGAENIFGWTQTEAMGRAPEELLGIDDFSAVYSLRAAVEQNGYWGGELKTRTRDGRKLIVEAHTTLVRDKEGTPLARLNFFADVTEKKLLEEKFLHAQRLESIGMLAAGIAHDLNNVFAPIVFGAPLLRDSLNSQQDLRILSSIEASAGRGAGLVKQILGFANSAAGEVQSTQVRHLARDILVLIEETFPKFIKLESLIPSDLWIVNANPTQIHQILLNLCVNARDAMPKGGTLRLALANRTFDEQRASAVSGALPGSWLEIEVADTGTGIAPDVLARIWDPFFTTKPLGKGTGLGLSTVRGIVASHRGFITLETQLDRGTTFRVFLPVTSEKMPGRGGSSAPGVFDGQGKLVLVVEDDGAIRESMVTILAKHRYRVLSAADGLEAVDRFSTQLADIVLVITDWDMPGLGGEALARMITRLRPSLPVLVISGLSHDGADEAEREAMTKLGHAFLQKPFTSELLLESAQKLVNPVAIS